MNGSRSASRPCSLSLARRLWARLARCAALLLGWICGLSITGAARAQAPGFWEGPWDWECLVYPTSYGNVDLEGKEFSHAGLIPVGPWRGRVLLWRSPRLTSSPYQHEVWVFDPMFPQILFKVDQDLPDDIFCSGMTWDPSGIMNCAGGSKTVVSAAYRFNPQLLRYPVHLPTSIPPCPGILSFIPKIPGVPWLLNPNWPTDPTPSIVGEMSIDRYYPALITLVRRLIAGTPSNIPASSSFVLGGETGAGGGQGGNEFWQMLPPHPALQWSHTHVSDMASHPITPPAGSEVYKRKSFGMEPLPDPILNSYARMLQLADFGTSPNVLPSNIMLATDVSEAGPLSEPGASWIIRLRYAGGPPDNELWRCRPAGSMPPDLTDPRDRSYGGAYLFHCKNGNPPHSNGLNRVITMNGAGPKPAPSGPETINDWVQEFKPGSDPINPDLGAEWVKKDTGLIYSRDKAVGVILPTGQILVEGGETPVNQSNPAGPRTPAIVPELYTIGKAGQATEATTTAVAVPNPAPGFAVPFQRLYHQVGVLMPDGRVFFAGGSAGAYGAPSWPNRPNLTGELYSPWYFQEPWRSQRPMIHSGPESVVFGADFSVVVDWVAGKPVDDFVLLRPAAITHHFDSDQRYIELNKIGSNVQGTQETVTLQGLREDFGPAGYYMLFALRTVPGNPAVKVPSVAHFIKFE